LDKNTIDPNLPDAHYPLATDIDSDGDLDVIVTSMGGDELVWYKNESLKWSKRPIDVTLDGPRIIDSADFDEDNKLDLVVTGWNANKLVWYNNKPTVAHAKSLQSNPGYISNQGDSLTINALLYNPDNHPVTVNAVINNIQNTFTDSILLYDDGQHNDSLANDNIWGNSVWLSGLNKDIYKISINTFDIAENYSYDLIPTSSFTTIGPVVLDHYRVASSDTIPHNTDKLKFEYALRNDDLTNTASNVTSNVVALDTFSRITSISTSYGNIQAGTTVVGLRKQFIRFNLGEHDSINVRFKIDILSNSNLFWSDTFSVFVFRDPAGIELLDQDIPSKFSLKQNYPNPFNPITNIEFLIPKTEFVTLKIYNLLGQEIANLVSDKLKVGKYRFTWNATSLASGVYLYRLQAGNHIETRKMILMQ